jgi:hypothetical protein
VTALATLSLADLRAAVDEWTSHCQVLGLEGDVADRNLALRTLRAELSRRVAEIAAAAVQP